MFDQRRLDKKNNQTRDIFNTYIYKTDDDTCAETQAVGYFAESRFATSEPDKWFGGVLEVKCSDGFYKGLITPSGEVNQLLPPVASFCASPTYTPTIIGGGQTTTIIGNSLTGTNTAGTVGNNTPVVVDPAFGFTSQSSVVHIESTFGSQIGSGNAFSIAFSQASPLVGFGDLVCALIVTPDTGVIFDAFAAAPVGNISTVSPGVYIISLDLDTNTGTCTFKDNSNNPTPTAITVSGAYNNLNATYAGFAPNSANVLNDSITQIANVGDSAFALPTAGAVAYCNA